MNREEILAMEVGRELDELIAIKIIEIPKPDYIPQHSLELFLAGSPVYYGCWTCVHEYGKGDEGEWVPIAFSTDISAAWQVVEKDGAWDFKKRFRPHPDDPPGAGGRATYQAIVFLSDYNPYEDELTNKRTGRSPWYWQLPEAICKAALLTKLAEIKRLEEGEHG